MSGLPAPFQRWLTILMPPLALLVCCIVMVPRQNKLRSLHRDIRRTQADISLYLERLKAIEGLPPDPLIATMPMSRQEQSDFLRGLTVLCSRTGNQIRQVTSLAPPPPKPGAQPARSKSEKGKKEDDLPKDVLEIKSTITFEGTYPSLRAFLSGLQQSRRLIAPRDCRISLAPIGHPYLQSAVTISRYVDAPPEYLAAAQPGAAPRSAPSS